MSHEIPMPPADYQQLVCGDRVDLFEEVGSGAVGLMESLGMLGGDVHLLDVGCGCGRVARYLIDGKVRSYVGFDRHPGMVEWCQEEISSRYPNFRFDYFALRSSYVKHDGHSGDIDVGSFSFPYKDDEFDSIFLTSVFTHMPLIEIDHYLKQLHRVLADTGKMLTTVLLSDGEPYDSGTDFWLDRDEWLGVVEGRDFRLEALTADRSSDEQHYYLLTKD